MNLCASRKRECQHLCEGPDDDRDNNFSVLGWAIWSRLRLARPLARACGCQPWLPFRPTEPSAAQRGPQIKWHGTGTRPQASQGTLTNGTRDCLVSSLQYGHKRVIYQKSCHAPMKDGLKAHWPENSPLGLFLAVRTTSLSCRAHVK